MTGYEIFVGWRYLRSKRKEVGISVISLISMSGVAIGVMALIIVLAVMTGMMDNLRDKILGAHAHILIFKRTGGIADAAQLSQRLAQDARVVGVSPFILQQVLMQSNDGSAEVTVKGIDPQAERRTSNLANSIIQGQLDSLDAPDASGHGVVIGSVLAQKLQVALGDAVTLIAPMQAADSSWTSPRMQVFQVVGIFEYGMNEYDASLVYSSLTAAQAYFRSGGLVDGIAVKVANLFQSRNVAEEMERELGISYNVRDWSDLNKNLAAVFSLYKKLLFLMLTIIVIVACLNIASTLIMMVMEKNQDIAILKSMGASAAGIQRIFVLQGVLIGTIGTLCGGVLGVAACWIADTYHLIPLEGAVYYLSYLPFKVMPLDVALVVLSSVSICFVSTLYPAKQAARLDPAVALRCE